MSRDWEDKSGFEGFRRNRKRRQLESGPKRDLGARAGVLRELEQCEAQELANQRMSREVHEFFSDATRTAAEIVQRVTHDAETEHRESVTHDMLEFLQDAVQRAQAMILEFNSREDVSTAGITEIEPMIHNIVGRQLDEFRNEGTAQVDDKHFGQDPFHTEVTYTKRAHESDVEVDEVEIEGDEDTIEIEEHLVADVAEPEPIPEPEPEPPQPEPPKVSVEIPEWIRRAADDPKKLANLLKSLVAQSVLTKDEALAMFHELT